MIIGLVVLTLAVVFALVFSPTIVRPSKRIAARTHALTNGNYALRLQESRRDEFGELARDINELSLTLENSEKTRQRWLADTSHELRTPLSVVKAQIEAILDGIHGYDEKHLLSLQPLVQRTQSVEIYGDEKRLLQLFDNLVNNCCKYTEPGGQVLVAIGLRAGDEKNESGADRIVIDVEDSAPGLPEDALPHLFDHLYRVESSRNRRTGGAGLGLAIAARIVEGHSGELNSMHSELGGLRIMVSFPREM